MLEAVGNGHVAPDDVPDGWYTVEQMAEALSPRPSLCRMRERARMALAAGKLERRKYRVSDGESTRYIWHYRAK